MWGVLFVGLLHSVGGAKVAPFVKHTECRVHTYQRSGGGPAAPLPLKCDYADYMKRLGPTLSEEKCWAECTDRISSLGLYYSGTSYVGTKEGAVSQDALDFMLHEVRNADGYSQNVIVMSVLDGHGESGHVAADIASNAQHEATTHFVKRNIPFSGNLRYFRDMLIGIYQFLFKRMLLEQKIITPNMSSLQTSGSTITTIALVSTEVPPSTTGGAASGGGATGGHKPSLKWHIGAYNLGDSRAVLIETPKKTITNGVVKYRPVPGESPTKIPGVYLTKDYNFALAEERKTTMKDLKKMGYIFVGSFQFAASRDKYFEHDEFLLWSKDVEHDPTFAQYTKANIFNMISHLECSEEALSVLKNIAAQLKAPLYVFDYKSFVRTQRNGLRADPFRDPRHLIQRSVQASDVNLPNAFSEPTKDEEDRTSASAWYLLKIGDQADDSAVLGVQPSSSLGDFALKPIIRSSSMLSRANLVPSTDRDTMLIVATDGLWERLDKYFYSIDKFQTAGINWIWKNAVHYGHNRLGELQKVLYDNARKAGSADDVTMGILWIENAAIDHETSPPSSIGPGEGEAEELLQLISR